MSSPPLFDVITAVNDVANKFQAYIEEGDMTSSIEETISTINQTAKEFKGLLVDIKKKQGTVGRLFYDESLYIKTEEFLDDLKSNPWKLLYKPKENRRKN